MTIYGTEYFETVLTQPGLNSLQDSTCKLIDFSLLVLDVGDTYQFSTGPREYGLVALTGTANLTVNGQPFDGIGQRNSVFAGAPSMVYAPCHAEVTITGVSKVEIAFCSCPSEVEIEPYRIDPGDCIQGKWGRFNTTRLFNFMIDQRRPSQRLYLAEVTVSSGNWATYPPHKHEADTPGEIFQEEMYYYRTEPVEGFGFCGLYGASVGSDYAFIIRNNTILKIPFGFHTLSAGPGCKIWYLALFAGDSKTALPSPDPNYLWWNKLDIVLENLEDNFMR